MARLGGDMRISIRWRPARVIRVATIALACFTAWAATGAPREARELAVWMEPPPVLGRPSRVTVHALDRERRSRVRGTVTIHGAWDTTRFVTNRPFTYVFRCVRTRRETVTVTKCDDITVSAPGYLRAVVSYAGNVHPARP